MLCFQSHSMKIGGVIWTGDISIQVKCRVRDVIRDKVRARVAQPIFFDLRGAVYRRVKEDVNALL